MPAPDLTLFCELGPEPLTRLFARSDLIDELASYGHMVALAIIDFSDERAGVVRCLNQRGVPVVAWLVLPEDEGYWFNLSNYPQAVARYRALREWAQREELQFVAVGFDFEPSLHEMRAVWRYGPLHLFNRASRAQINALYPAARQAYLDLAASVRADGYELHTYQYSVLVDDRRAGTTLLQRTLDVLDLPADLEVLMLYSSSLHRRWRRLGGAFVRSYAQQADGVAIGVTGGGVVLDLLTGTQAPRMTINEFRRDLLLAAHYTDNVHIFSLEGCVERGWLHELRHFDWDAPVVIRRRHTAQIELARGLLGFGLWLSRYGLTALGWLGWLVVAIMMIGQRVQRWQRRSRKDESYAKTID